MRTTLAIVILLPLAFACGTQTAVDQTAGGTLLSQRCTNPRHQFSVSYPDEWHTNSGAVIAACSAFDPAPMEIPPASEMPFEISVVIDIENVPYQELTRPSIYERVVSSEKLTIDGRDAFRVEAEASGQGLAPPGMRSLRYVVDLGAGRSLIATTHDTGEEYEGDKEILMQMMQSLALP